MNVLPLMVATLLLSAPAPQQPEEAMKAQLKAVMDATGFKYGVTTSGKNYTVVFDHAEKRTQTVYVNVNPSKAGTVTTYYAYTQVWYGDSAPDAALMQKVLSRTKKLGTFYLFKDSKGTWTIRFGARFDATDMKEAPTSEDALVKALKDVIYLVSIVGEETDKELNGEKDMR
jgi:hypothetical protein